MSNINNNDNYLLCIYSMWAFYTKDFTFILSFETHHRPVS